MNKEYAYRGLCLNGFLMLGLMLVMVGVAVWSAMTLGETAGPVVAVLIAILLAFCSKGFIMLQPNQAMVLTFFGKYSGTFSITGYHWINPLMTARKVSLRLFNLDIPPIKVNDKEGNPIMIGMVLVWQIRDTYRATFDIDQTQSLARFVAIQSDAALREVAGGYAYDDDGHDSNTLRSGGEHINRELVLKLNERLSMAGIHVEEARINYLAYAPEIAAVMLRRQQASAIISAREKIVEGAVTMVKMALDRIDQEQMVTLDNERRAAMVGNLLLVLCSDEGAQPVIPAGSGSEA